MSRGVSLLAGLSSPVPPRAVSPPAPPRAVPPPSLPRDLPASEGPPVDGSSREVYQSGASESSASVLVNGISSRQQGGFRVQPPGGAPSMLHALTASAAHRAAGRVNITHSQSGPGQIDGLSRSSRGSSSSSSRGRAYGEPRNAGNVLVSSRRDDGFDALSVNG